MAFDEDLSGFFDPADFGEVGTVTPQNGAPSFTLNGILDTPFQQNRARDVVIVTDKPTFTCRSVDAAPIRRGDTLAVLGQTYDVLEVEPDGTGVSVVMMASQ